MIRSIEDLKHMKEAYLEKMASTATCAWYVTAPAVCLPVVKMFETPWWKSWEKGRPFR